MPYKSNEDQKKAARLDYLLNQDAYKRRAKAGRKKSLKRNREFVARHLREHPCVDCGNTDIRVLEFDHVRGEKVDAIANLVRRMVSIDRLSVEIGKCEVRCSNCHRIKTWERRQSGDTLSVDDVQRLLF